MNKNRQKPSKKNEILEKVWVESLSDITKGKAIKSSKLFSIFKRFENREKIIAFITSFLTGALTSFLTVQALNFVPEEQRNKNLIIEHYKNTQASVVSPQEVLADIQNKTNKYTLLDTRSYQKYISGHISWAVHLWEDFQLQSSLELAAKIKELSKWKTVVLYWENAYDTQVLELWNSLAQVWTITKHMNAGWHEWRFKWNDWNSQWTKEQVTDYIEYRSPS